LETAFRSTAAPWLLLAAATQLMACGGAPFELAASTQAPSPIDAGSEASTAADVNPIDAGSDIEASTTADARDASTSGPGPDAGPPSRYLRDGAACYEVPTRSAKCGSDDLVIPTDYCADGTLIPDGVPTQCQCTDTYTCACIVAAYAAAGVPFGCACSQDSDGVITFGCK
jgi:hypothetical protein